MKVLESHFSNSLLAGAARAEPKVWTDFQLRRQRKRKKTTPTPSNAVAEGSGTTVVMLMFWKAAEPELLGLAVSFEIWK